MKDYYEILAVHPKAPAEVIKKAYTTLAKMYHPDTTTLDANAAHIKMAELNEAYEVLSDPEKRKIYDTQGSVVRVQQSQLSTNSNTNKPNSESISIAKHNLRKICDRYINLINTRILNNNNSKDDKRNFCLEYKQQFYKEVSADLQLIEQSNAFDKQSKEYYGVTLWYLACGFHESGELLEAYNAINNAKQFIDSEYSNYAQFEQSAQQISHGYFDNINANPKPDSVTSQNAEQANKNESNNSGCLANIIELIFTGIGLFIANRIIAYFFD